MSESRMYLEMSDPEIQKAISEKRILFFSAGAVEQHGAHTPTGVDIYLPLAVTNRVAEIVGGVVAPCTNYGYKSLLRSGGGPHFVSSIGLRGSTTIALIKDIFSEFIRHGWRRIVVFEWHLENCPFVYEGIDEAIRESGVKDEIKVIRIDNIVTPAFELDPGIIDFVFDGNYKGMVVEHASTWETSLMMAIKPELVHMENAVVGSLPVPFDYDVLPVPKDAAPKSGVFDDPTRATQPKGERLMKALIQATIDIINKEFDLGQ